MVQAIFKVAPWVQAGVLVRVGPGPERRRGQRRVAPELELELEQEPGQARQPGRRRVAPELEQQPVRQPGRRRVREQRPGRRRVREPRLGRRRLEPWP